MGGPAFGTLRMTLLLGRIAVLSAFGAMSLTRLAPLRMALRMLLLGGVGIGPTRRAIDGLAFLPLQLRARA